ncbi:phage terminase large subunit [Brevundimonas sp.]|uniref:phage terminase large subunit n=1 Tax=Brevundimonas sp. TaxID=1871086 RepID=UPI002FC66362
MDETPERSFEDHLKSDFTIFVRYVWKEVLHLPPPTRTQLDIAEYLAGNGQRKCIQAFRGVGKSFLTCAYVVWCLWNDPQKTVLIVSAGEKGAADNATLIKQIILHEAGDGLWDHLIPARDQRSSTLAFDVGPALSNKQPSVKCLGITGQLAGNRADILIADDVENQRNSATEDQRDKLRHATSEFGKIIKPTEDAEIIYLGTPQTEESIYSDLPARGYGVRIWPARYPLQSKIANYAGHLAPMIALDIERCGTVCDPSGLSLLGGQPVDPARFTDQKLLESELDGTAAEFMLQMMLDVTLSDAERFPLKTSDLIVMDVDLDRAPIAVSYASNDEKQIRDSALPNVGFTGDRFFSPLNVSEHWTEYTGSVMHVDPSGSGNDETAYVVTKFLNGRIFVSAWGGMSDGTSPATLLRLAEIAKEQKVNSIVVEDNFGDGMFRQLLTPIVIGLHTSKWRCGVEGMKVHGQKEKRIVGAIEPVLKQHKIIMDRTVLRNDLKSDRVRSGVYQLTHMTSQRGALKHDDRIDVLAMAVDYWKSKLAVDQARAEAEHLKKLDREFEKRFFAGTAVAQLLNKDRGRGRGRPMR